VRRAALLEKFGSVAAIKKSSIEEISKIPGIGATIATIIFDHLTKPQDVAFDALTGEIVEGA